MAQPFIAEIRIWANTFAPMNWTFCDGQLMSIPQFSAVYALVGTQYGGDGRSTFGIPNMQTRAPMHWGHAPGLSSYNVTGVTSGSPEIDLTAQQLPSHDHSAIASSQNGSSEVPAGNLAFGRRREGGVGVLNNYIENASANTSFSNLAISQAGSGNPHENRQPYLGINFCMALEGLFPSRN